MKGKLSDFKLTAEESMSYLEATNGIEGIFLTDDERVQFKQFLDGNMTSDALLKIWLPEVVNG